MADVLPGNSPDFDPRSVPIKPAATVMLLRDVAEGIEVFMLRRSMKAVFAGGVYVFPGGRVDDADSAEELEPYCAGLDDAAASAALGIDHGGLAFWVAAIRECFEEAGVLIGRHRDGSEPKLDGNARHAVHDGELSMEDLCRQHDLVLNVGEIAYVSHWLTPVGEPRRFDTRFFLTAAPVGQEPAHDNSETVASWWVRPQDALAAMDAGDLFLMPPTIANLQSLVPHRTTTSAFEAARDAGPPERIEPKMRLDDDGGFAGVALPGDPDYASLG